MKEMAKTNAARILNNLHVTYNLKTYEVKDEHQSATNVAETLGIEPELIYKTLVLTGQKDPYIVAVIPGNAQVDLKKLAHISGNKKCEMLPMKDLQHVTGYIRGGCSPIGMKKSFPTYLEELSSLENKIIISAGKKGLQIEINPHDLISVTHANFADIICIA
ncbi:Cys-tRNA(Pro)/Cys-tRNA(Cys) deacylase YbaK [compost metagenome]